MTSEGNRSKYESTTHKLTFITSKKLVSYSSDHFGAMAVTVEQDICRQNIYKTALPGELRPYQWDGVQFLVNRESVLLADEMGLGKTVQVSVALGVLKEMLGSLRVLVVAPACLKLNWESELRHWAPNLSVQRVRGDAIDRCAYYALPINVLIGSYEEIRIDSARFPKGVCFDAVILDEAQRIKNAGSRVSLACKLIRRSRSWALTGTPIENQLDDLVSIFAFVKRGIIYDGLPRAELHARMRPYFLRRRKMDVAKELPPILDQEIPIELSGLQRIAYLDAWNHRFSQDIDGTRPELRTSCLLAVLTKLKQLCNYDPDSGESAKFEMLKTILENAVPNGEKIILFSQYVSTLRWLSERLGDIPRFMFHGGLAGDAKEKVLQTFRQHEGSCILLMSLRAGGVGLNIQEASTVLLFDRWWNPALESQAIQRAHRFGRREPLQVLRFITIDTVEERIRDILRQKQRLFDGIVETASGHPPARIDGEFLESVLEIQPR